MEWRKFIFPPIPLFINDQRLTHSVALKVNDWDTQLDASLAFWGRGLMTSDLAATFVSASAH